MRFAVLLLLAAAANAQRYTVSEVTENGVRYILLADNQSGIEAAISPERGGELAGLRVRFQGKPVELLYRARDYSRTAGWTGKAPLLWPAVARNFAKGVTPDGNATECSYDWKGRKYDIEIHGFARNLPWNVIEKRASSDSATAVLTLADTPQTRAAFPFGFRLSVAYTIRPKGLSIAYTVHSDAKNAEPMFFSIGNHITFRTPFVEGSNLAEMTFQSPSEVEYLKDATTLPSGKQGRRSFDKPATLDRLVATPAISLGGYRGDPWVLLRDPAGLGVRLSHHADSWPEPPLVQFNVWGDASKGYFSPEPWVGIQNSLNLRQALITLPAGKDWRWTIQVEPQQ